MKTRRFHSHAGMTLIEVLVAILIFSFGLLGFVGLQARAIQYSSSAEDTNRAALLANEMSATLQMSQSASVPAGVVTAWQSRVASNAGGVPNGLGTVTTAGNVATVTITWQSPNAAASSATLVNKYVTEVVIP